MFKKFAELVAGKAIKSIKPNVPKTKIEKKIRDLKIQNQKLKGGKAKLDQTLFEIRHKQPITFKTKKGKSESNKEAYKRIQGENTKAIKSMVDEAFNRNKESQKIFKKTEGKDVEKKATGGRVGLKRGTGLMKKKSNVQKIKETFSPKKSAAKKKKFPDLTGDGKVTFADILKGRGVKRG